MLAFQVLPLIPPMTDRSANPILVTGAAGFIGYHVTMRLLAAGRHVIGIDNLNPYYNVRLKEARLRNLQERPTFIFEQLDITDYKEIRELAQAQRPGCLIHLAAQAGVRYSIENPRAYVSSNIDGFLSILEACRHTEVGHLIYASSSSVYGENAKLPFSEHDPADHPVSFYAATKRANELMAHSYAHLYGIPATGLRFFTVYGPWGRPDMAYFKFTEAIFEGRTIDIYNHGQMQRDLTYIDDVAEAIFRLVNCPPASQYGSQAPSPALANRPHRIYNIGNHTPIGLDRFIAVIEAAVGREAVRRFLPMQSGDVPTTYADVDDLAAAVGFAPRTPIEEGIPRFVAWYRDFYAGDVYAV